MTYSRAMCTDLYQLTMAYGYWKLGRHKKRAIFDLFFRELPFKGSFAVACGLEKVLELVQSFKFEASDLQYLASLKTEDRIPLFEPVFLDALKALRLSVNIHAVPEGTVVFAKEPLLRVEGPLWECQLLETVLLNIVNFSTLIATKAARVTLAAGSDPVIEFGLRRAQGPDGGLTASRACFVGGVGATSNTLAGQVYGIPVRGTHAHSWVMAFDNELEAFKAYAEVMPHQCALLVDTYQTIEGVKHAIEVGNMLKAKGHRLSAIRLDSGDLKTLSSTARTLLDEAGLKECKIMASGDLDEYSIASLKKELAPIDIWGVGTRLVTGFDQPALGGVYKLVAFESGEQWHYKAKITDDLKKISYPGIHQIRRLIDNGRFMGDTVYDIHQKQKPYEGSQYEELLVSVIQDGKLVYDLPALEAIQQRTLKQISSLPKEVAMLRPTATYKVGFERNEGE